LGAPGDRHIRAAAGQELRSRLADAFAAARDDGDPAAQLITVRSHVACSLDVQEYRAG
jgi:hypothetical protein